MTLKIAFFWTPDFAADILKGILEYPEIECKLVVSQPDKQVGRKQKYQTTPVKRCAVEAGIEVVQPVKIKVNPDLERWQSAKVFQDLLRSLELDFIIVVAYGKIIPKEILDIPKYGCVNIHGSLLPKYRWASPVQAAIKAGEKETWLTIMYMSEGMDEGDMLSQGKIQIDKVDTSEDIFEKMKQKWPDLLVTTLKWIITWEINGIPQDDSKASYCWKISREDGEMLFQKQAAQEIYNTYRAYTSWPGIFTFFQGKRLVIKVCTLCENSIQAWIWVPGMCIKIEKNRYGIVCRDGNILELQQVKLEGKKSMDIQSFVNGNKEVLGYILE